MRRMFLSLMASMLVLGVAMTGWAGETTLEKINRTGVFTVGTRTASPPFGDINKNNEWVGFSVDLAEVVHKVIEKKLNKTIEQV
ncbi:MAG TPA: hypothetical protein VMD08_16430 [Candidatus Baltobacteraceae bacterium]|nr:hypothetical protein [Candidatus Baltobacteraceae bacterium]